MKPIPIRSASRLWFRWQALRSDVRRTLRAVWFRTRQANVILSDRRPTVDREGSGRGYGKILRADGTIAALRMTGTQTTAALRLT